MADARVLGMVIDAIFVKAMGKTEEEEATIVVSMLGKDAAKLVHSIQTQFLAALEAQAVGLSLNLIFTTSQVLIIATKRYRRVVKGAEEGPTPEWLRRYLTKEVLNEVFKAWDKKDLVWVSLAISPHHLSGFNPTSRPTELSPSPLSPGRLLLLLLEGTEAN